MVHGEARAEEFLTALAFESAWKSCDPDAVLGFFADHAEIISSAPFSHRGTYSGAREIRNFVADYLAGDVHVDLTRKQVARNGVAWKVRAPASSGLSGRSEGVAEAVFRGRQIESLRLGDGR
jgi:NTE family protein